MELQPADRPGGKVFPLTYAVNAEHNHAVETRQVGGREAQTVLLDSAESQANRKVAVFDDPLKFDVLRDPGPHAGCGRPGPRFCLGARLARREIKVTSREIFDRVGDVRAAGEPGPLSSASIHGVRHLPAELAPSKPVGASA